MTDPEQILCDLISNPSVNPMGKDRTGPEFFEERVTDYLQKFFDTLGLPWQRQTAEPARDNGVPQRDNIIARLDANAGQHGNDSGSILMFEAHQDTVPVDGMTIEPWTPVRKGARLYGRGSCDIKGGMAAMLTAFARLANERPSGMPTIIMACSVNEEHGFTGASAMHKLWETGSDSIIPRKPDAVIVAEPTMLDIVVAHKGVVRWKCHTIGRAVHSSRPELGENAIYNMAPVITSLSRYQAEVLPTFGTHSLCGGPTLSVGTIRGGLSVNTVPDGCTIEIDRRLLPGENPFEAYQQVVDFLSNELARPETVTHDVPYLHAEGLADDANGPLSEKLMRSITSAAGDHDCVGAHYGTDASAFQTAGIPTVVFGPGSIDQAHTVDEWLDVGQLEKATEILFQFGSGR